MGDHGVLRDLGETLRGVLWEAFEGTGLISNENEINLEDPKESPGKELKIFMFGVQEQTEMRNLPPVVADGAAGKRDYTVRPAPTYLTVDLLIVPSKQNAPDNLEVAGKVLEIFYDRPVIRGPFLRGEGLAGSDAELRVLLHPISLDDLTKLWSSFPDTKFKLSLCYRVYNVPLDSRRAEPAAAVKSIESGYGEGVKKKTEP
jgi:hypothetical protein